MERKEEKRTLCPPASSQLTVPSQKAVQVKPRAFGGQLSVGIAFVALLVEAERNTMWPAAETEAEVEARGMQPAVGRGEVEEAEDLP